MSKFGLGNLLLLVSVVCASGSHVLFKGLFNETGPLSAGWASVRALGEPGRAPRLAAALALLVGGFAAWLASLSRLDLSYAYPVACASALLVTLWSVVFLKEPVTLRTWGGTALIVAGTMLLAPGR
jgi:drug/metabolite transporter (DMT)-like permease